MATTANIEEGAGCMKLTAPAAITHTRHETQRHTVTWYWYKYCTIRAAEAMLESTPSTTVPGTSIRNCRVQVY